MADEKKLLEKDVKVEIPQTEVSKPTATDTKTDLSSKPVSPKKPTNWILIGLAAAVAISILICGGAAFAGALMYGGKFANLTNLTVTSTPSPTVTASTTPTDTVTPSVTVTPTDSTTPTPTTTEFTVTAITITAVNGTTSNMCDYDFKQKINVSANKAGTATLVIVRSDGGTSSKTVTFSGAGTVSVDNNWSFSGNNSYWFKAKITSPNAIETPQFNLVLSCTNVAGTYYHNFGDSMQLNQVGGNITGTYKNKVTGATGTITGTLVDKTVTGTWSISGNSGPLSLTFNGNQFDGTYSGSVKWCGSTSIFANGCSFAGTFTATLPGVQNCQDKPMTLQRNGNNVTGTYCNGTVSGTIGYQSNTVIVSGTYTTGGGATGTFKLLQSQIPGYSDQFRGNWNTVNAWCGWRNGLSQPAICLNN